MTPPPTAASGEVADTLAALRFRGYAMLSRDAMAQKAIATIERQQSRIEELEAEVEKCNRGGRYLRSAYDAEEAARKAAEQHADQADATLRDCRQAAVDGQDIVELIDAALASRPAALRGADGT